MIIAYSSLPGYASVRDHEKGTWFIQSLVEGKPQGADSPSHQASRSRLKSNIKYCKLRAVLEKINYPKEGPT
jgi:hypothetical protein